ncbi:MAG: M1 family metallopeptidase [Chitinophagales bacterium]
MRKLFLFILFNCQLSIVNCQFYWQQQVNVTIDVTLHDKENSLDAFEKLEYINNSPDTLKFIWFHLWPNAYKNDRTAFTDQTLLNGDTRFYFSNKEQKGYINRLDFKVNSITCTIEDHPLYIDIVKVILPSPLPPGQKIIISTPFHVQLPYNFSRGGHDGESYQVTQWYPKPAVYDKNGWHPMPYLEQGEYYSEFGNFDVQITVPKNYVVAATGELENEDEKNWLLTRSHFSWQPIKQKIKSKGGVVKTTVQKFPLSSPETKTLRYSQNNIHDFAWFADKRFIVNHDTCQLSSGKVIDIFTYYTQLQKETWKNSLQYARQSIKFYSSQIGEYPYSVVSVVQGPESFGGGMEYPTITVISPTSSPEELDITIAHEIGHNWFQGALASNERDHPWMDEGINSFYEHRYSQKYYNEVPSEERTFFETIAKERSDQPIETTSENFNETNYELVAYYKTSEWLQWLEKQIGKDRFDEAMKEYYKLWQFKHPQPEDFKEVIEKSSGQNMDSAFAYLHKKGTLPNQQRSGTKIDFLLKPGYLQSLLNNRYQDLITISPAIGANSYDDVMAGIFITNVKLPLNNFNFFLAPMYGFGSKRFTGLGKLDYSFYPNKTFQKIDLFLNGAAFSINKYTDTAAKNHFTGVEKLVPGARFVFREKDPRSTVKKYIQWKTFFISEEEFRFPIDTVANGPDTSIVTNVNTIKNSRTLNQLKIVIQNDRALYPYRAELNAEQGKGFIRLGFTGNYFFNYPSNKGGADVRFFAGKFIYTNEQKANSFLYALNLSAPKGNLDYTYSDYFIGRNDYPFTQNGVKWTVPYQQIMIRDGGMKMNTDAQGKVGLTNNWLIASNASFDIPSRVNPLSLLPFKIPLKIFADVGTSAEFWKQNSETDHFLYDAGFQVSLLKNTVNIYIPVIYSSVFGDYLKSDFIGKNKFLKSISFSIDIANFNLKKIDSDLPF